MSEALKDSLCNMSAFAKIRVREEDRLQDVKAEDLKEYSAIVIGFKNFKDLEDIDVSK